MANPRINDYLFDKLVISQSYSFKKFCSVCNRPYGFEIHLVNLKTIRTNAQIFGGLLIKAELYIITVHYSNI